MADEWTVTSSARVGAPFRISGTAASMLISRDDQCRAYLTTWIIDQYRLSHSPPTVDSLAVRRAAEGKPLPVSERADRLLALLARMSQNVGNVVRYSFAYPHDDLYEMFLQMLAWSESVVWEEVAFLLEYLTARGWISYQAGPGRIVVAVAGYARLADLERTIVNSAQGFVAMWFGEEMKPAYTDGIKPGIELAGYLPFRIDGKEHNNMIDDEIVAEIRRSRFVVADFTHGETGMRGGVYYEAGLAHGLNLPVFWSCRKDVFDDKDKGIHFDLRQYNFIVWETPAELRDRLSQRISAVLGDGPQVTSSPAP